MPRGAGCLRTEDVDEGVEVVRIGAWCLTLVVGLFTLFRVVEAWVRPHQATGLFITASVTMVLFGIVLTAFALRALARGRPR